MLIYTYLFKYLGKASTSRIYTSWLFTKIGRRIGDPLHVFPFLNLANLLCCSEIYGRVPIPVFVGVDWPKELLERFFLALNPYFIGFTTVKTALSTSGIKLKVFSDTSIDPPILFLFWRVGFREDMAPIIRFIADSNFASALLLIFFFDMAGLSVMNVGEISYVSFMLFSLYTGERRGDRAV